MAQNENEYEPVGELVRIFRRGRKWYANYQWNGKQRHKALRTTSKKEARRKALLLEAELLRGDHQYRPKPPSIERVIEAHRQYAHSERRAPKTLVKYEQVYQRILALAKNIHRTNVLGIDPAFVDAYRHGRVAAGRAAKTLYNETMIIRQLVNFALSRGMIASDPLKNLRVKEPKPNHQPCWTREEVDRILANSPEQQRPAFILIAETGMRIGELRWLTWDDVDFDRNVLHIRPKDDWRPKTGDQRAIPMTPVVQTLLRGLTRRSRRVLTASPSCRCPAADRQVSERRLLKCLKMVLKRLCLKGHLHTFRHSFISHALTTGIPEAVVRGWVGHVDRDVIKLYTHINDEHSQAAMRRLAETGSSSEPGRCEPEDPGHGAPQEEE